MVVPGYATGDGSTWVLRRYLGALGYDVHGWGLGRNTGATGKLVPRTLEQVVALSARSGRRVHLVGWSLGGYLAREAARERPDVVTQVITLGTPVIGGPKYTLAAETYRRKGFDVDAIEASAEKHNQNPLPVPITAIYTRHDGIVAWQACIDPYNQQTKHVEVATTHIGLVFAADVYRILADQLARHKAEYI